MNSIRENSLIVRCLRCGRKNRIPRQRILDTPLCGHCGAGLDELLIQCIQCGAKNRVPEERLYEGPYCGRCGAPIFEGNALDLSDDTFGAEVLSFPGPALVCFWAPGCMTCKIILPALERLSSKYAGGIKIARMNIEKHTRMKEIYSIRDTPTFLFFSSGRLIHTLIGGATEEEIERHLKRIIGGR